MTIPAWIRPLFLLAAAYDLILGVVFLVAFKVIYARFDIALPNHPAYVQLNAALIAIFGIGFWFVARAPERNRDLIKLGILLKLAFAVTVLSYWFRHAIPDMWAPFAWADLAFAVAFVAALAALRPRGA
ncbi:MAG: hypothetical protein HZC42_08825 [Candidatus Eisenbacteria bacterium]|nr:hypothetical protein [Candidatus Eisenbacteria bacterium]